MKNPTKKYFSEKKSLPNKECHFELKGSKITDHFIETKIIKLQSNIFNILNIVFFNPDFLKINTSQHQMKN